MEKIHRGSLELGRSNFWCNLGIKMENFLSEGMKLWGSAEICSQHPVALEKKYPLLVINPAVPACLVEKTSSKNRVSVKVFPLLNVNAIDLLSLIKLSVCFSLHNLDKKWLFVPDSKRNNSLSSSYGVSLSLSSCPVCNTELPVVKSKAAPTTDENSVLLPL